MTTHEKVKVERDAAINCLGLANVQIKLLETKCDELHQVLSDTLGSLHIINGRAGMMYRYEGKGALPSEEGQAIMDERLKAHDRIVAALNTVKGNKE